MGGYPTIYVRSTIPRIYTPNRASVQPQRTVFRHFRLSTSTVSSGQPGDGMPCHPRRTNKHGRTVCSVGGDAFGASGASVSRRIAYLTEFNPQCANCSAESAQLFPARTADARRLIGMIRADWHFGRGRTCAALAESLPPPGPMAYRSPTTSSCIRPTLHTCRVNLAMSCTPASDSLILELEIRQDDALRQLVELEQRIEAVLRQALPADGRRIAPPQANSPSPPATQTPAARAA